MICLLCFFIFLLSTLSISAVMLCVFAGMACSFFPFMAYVIEIMVSFFGFWSEIGMYIICGLIEAVDAFVRFCIHMSPFVSRGCSNVYNSFPYIMNDLWHNLNNARVEILNFIQNQREWIIYCWGLVLLTLFMFKNQIHNFFHGYQTNNHNRHSDRQYRPENEDDSDNYDLNEDNDFNDENRRNWRNNGEQNVRNRQGNEYQRLYSALVDDSNQVTDDDDEYVHVNNQADNARCIVCFERDRNTAIFPCGHTQTCEQCIRNILTRNNRCPVCQSRVAEYRTIYL